MHRAAQKPGGAARDWHGWCGCNGTGRSPFVARGARRQLHRPTNAIAYESVGFDVARPV
jgi:hypothetical protein